MNLVERLQKEVMILDGSMGVFLQSEGLPAGYAPDLWNLEKPELLISVHKKYAEAGSQIVITNTFGATRLRLDEFGRGSDVAIVNRAAVENARKGAGGSVLVAGDIGPAGKLVAPLGDLAFDDAIVLFKEQVSALLDAGVDILIIETMFDLMEMKAAIIACNDLRKSTPLIASMTFTGNATTDTGTTPEAAAAVLEGLGVDIAAVNCSTGPEDMLEVVKRYGEATSLPICVQPNAGLPVMENGQTVFKESPDVLAGYAEKFVALGANIIGGCCGTKPEYIEKVCKAVKGKPPVPRKGKSGTVIASRSEAICIGTGHPFAKIGEKINPTGRKKFSAAIKEGRTDLIVMEARKEAEAGATALDVNVGVPLVDEPAMMARAIIAVQNITPLPLVIDSSNNDALVSGLGMYAGRALVNSVNAEEEKLETVLPLVKRMGAAVIALTAGDEIPESAEKRLEYARTILDRALQLGLRKEDIIFDCLAVVVSAMQEGANQTLRTIRMIKEELGCATIVGLSNVSFGLPGREMINSSFLAMAMAEGLDAAIVNPYKESIHQTALAASLFTRRDEGCKVYIDTATKADKEAEEEKPKKPQTTAEKIFNAVLEGEKDSIQLLVKAGLDEGLKPMDIFSVHLTPGIRKLGDLFAEKKKFIPHLVASADTMKKGMDILNPLLLKERAGGENKGTIVFATVKGDVHDIGKNVCCLMLENFGFNVIDLGRNVPLDDILKAAEENEADIIGLSALMTTTMIQMPLVIEEVAKRKLPYKIMVGGAALTRGFAKEIGADGYGKSVGDVVTLTEGLMEKIKA